MDSLISHKILERERERGRGCACVLMALLRAPCAPCSSINLTYPNMWSGPRNHSYYPLNSSKCRRKITSELQIPVGVSGRVDASFSSIQSHKVTVHDRQRGLVHEFFVPEDQYILHTAESQDIALPFACRHGCCTSCAVRVKSGQIRQPEALGISAELKSKASELILLLISGYALLCVGFPSSDLEVETQDEDEVYWLQFGRYFARGPIERDDYALELALADE
ncbi:2Fe-2S ferredoxin-type iron-sulfur binding domain [Dillenia turbinata]|uniref:2Fe-2S ferredoxin-type iron-sulfur binding domain n=1 Tax=Dillenia turbinata TaxID=194707 RepID=A0AAN8ZEN6_9MAGN